MRTSEEIRAALSVANERFEKLTADVRAGKVDSNTTCEMAIAGREASILEWVLEVGEETLREKQNELRGIQRQLLDLDKSKRVHFPNCYGGQFDQVETSLRFKAAKLAGEILKLKEGDRHD